MIEYEQYKKFNELIRSRLRGDDQTAFKKVKHIEQDTLIIYQMLRYDLLKSIDTNTKANKIKFYDNILKFINFI